LVESCESGDYRPVEARVVVVVEPAAGLVTTASSRVVVLVVVVLGDEHEVKTAANANAGRTINSFFILMDGVH
jgi:hypothetical protein